VTAFAIFGFSLIALMIATPFVIWFFSDARKRGMAKQVAALLADGRPRGCKCPPNPGSNALPSDNSHINSPRCPLTRGEAASDALAEVHKRLDDLEIALQVLAPKQPSGPWTGAHAAGPS
jgi:hypothetical protein